MIRLRNQFDTHRTHATAATPTCCCCCCCVVTLGTSTVLPAQMVYFHAKEKSKPTMSFLVILAVLLWPLSVLIGSVVGVFANMFLSRETTTYDAYSDYSYSEKTYIGGINPGVLGFIFFIITFFAITYVIFHSCHKYQAIWATPLFALACATGVVLDTILCFAVIAGIASAVDSVATGGGFAGAIVYFAITIAMIVFAAIFYARWHQKRFIINNTKPPQSPPGTPGTDPFPDPYTP